MIKKRYRPTFLAASFYEIPASFYREIGVKNLLLDLDNTLVPYRQSEPSEAVKTVVKSLQQAGLHLYIASNNTSSRVSHCASLLGIGSLSGLLKPFSFRLRHILRKENFRAEETILIGDQLMTDIPAANGAKIRSILVEPINPSNEPWVTRWNRFFEKRKRARLLKEGSIPSWKGKQ